LSCLVSPPGSAFILSRSGAPLVLYSFPTRRSSDLAWKWRSVGAIHNQRNLVLPGQRFQPGQLFIGNHIPGGVGWPGDTDSAGNVDRKSTRLNSSHVKISYAVFCLKKKKYTHYTKYR